MKVILDLPVQLTAEMGRKDMPLNHILQLAVGSIVELETIAGEPMDVPINGYLIAQGEVVVVNGRLGIGLTDVVSHSQRLRRLTRRRSFPKPVRPLRTLDTWNRAPDFPWPCANPHGSRSTRDTAACRPASG